MSNTKPDFKELFFSKFVDQLLMESIVDLITEGEGRVDSWRWTEKVWTV